VTVSPCHFIIQTRVSKTQLRQRKLIDRKIQPKVSYGSFAVLLAVKQPKLTSQLRNAGKTRFFSGLQYSDGYFRPVYPLCSTTLVPPLPPGTSTFLQFNAAINTGFSPNPARVMDALGDDGQFVFFRGIPPVVETGLPPI